MPAEVGSDSGPWADKVPEKGMTAGIGLHCPARLRGDNIVV